MKLFALLAVAALGITTAQADTVMGFPTTTGLSPCAQRSSFNLGSTWGRMRKCRPCRKKRAA